MNIMVSFIIPAYNAACYIRKCLNSFLYQNVQEKVEVIIVDDGSTDQTAEIAREYVKQNPKMYRLLQKSNGGHGSAINVGTKSAAGKYFKVVDADDWVMTEHLTAFVRYLESCDADVVLTPYHILDQTRGERTLQRVYLTDYGCAYSLEEICRKWKSFDRCTTFHGITYRTDFYNDHRHVLPHRIFYEDQEYASIPFCHARKIAFFELAVYQYRIGRRGQSVDAENQVKRSGDLERVIADILRYWRDRADVTVWGKLYLRLKLEDSVLSYYRVQCITNPDKAVGRHRCSRLNARLYISAPALYRQMRVKYSLYILFSLLRVNETVYKKLIHSAVFRLLRHNHKIEREQQKRDVSRCAVRQRESALNMKESGGRKGK